MVALLIIVNTLVLGVATTIGFRRGRIYTVLFGALALLEVSSVLRLGEDLRLYGERSVVYGQGLMLVGNVVLAVVVLAGERSGLGWPGPSRASMRLVPRDINRYIALVSVLLALAYVARFRSGLGSGLASWQTARAGAGPIDAITTVFAFYAVPAPVVLWLARRRVTAVLFLPFVALYIQLAGSRALALTLPSYVILLVLQSSRPIGRKALFAGALGVSALAGFTMFRVVRSVPVAELRTNFVAALATPGNDISGGESRMMGSFYYLIAADRGDFPFDAAVTPQRLVSIYLPRATEGIPKPGDITYSIWSNYVDDGYLDRDPYYTAVRALADAESPGSDHPTVWGDAFANWRAFGVPLAALVLGAFALVLERAAGHLSPIARVLLLPVVAVTYQFCARGNVVIAFGYLAYGVPVVAALLRMSGMRTLGGFVGRTAPAPGRPA